MIIRNLNFLFVVLLVGCSAPYSKPEIVGDSPKAIGIADLLSQPTVEEIDVFLVHGMCTHDSTWVAEINNNFLRMLGSNLQVKSTDLKSTAVFDNETQLYSMAFTIAGKTLWTHSILWSPSTIPVKNSLCYDRNYGRNANSASFCEEAPEYFFTRAAGNDMLKSELMNDCLADAMVYIGSTGSRVRDQVARAIEYAGGSRTKDNSPVAVKRAAESNQTPLIVYSESLGSKVFFDTLLQMENSGENNLVAQRTFERITQIFMGANQIPILSLVKPVEELKTASGPATSQPLPFVDPLNELILRFGARLKENLGTLGIQPNGRDNPIQVVAFSDPNDLLSYPLRGSKQAASAQYHTIDVIVSNAPTYFGLLENPMTAHLSYRNNPEVHKIIVCGIPKNRNCDRE